MHYCDQRERLRMANVNEKDATNFRIRTKLLSTCSGAGVNAASNVNLAFATTDHPLSELVWSPHTGLSLKCANRDEDVRKPFLLWNVGPSSVERGNGDDHDMIIHKELGRPSHDVVEREADSFHPQTVQTDESRIEVAEGVVPAAPAEGSCMGSRRRGKALSDGDIYRRSSNEEDDSVESSMSTRLTPKGVKRKICDEDAILGSKKMKKQNHGSDGSTFVMKPDSSFMKWISNMMTNGRPHPNNEDSESPLPLACSNDVYSKNFVCFKPLGSAAASISMGFQAVFQSLYCRETDELSTGEEKMVEPIEVSREGALDGVKSPENIHVDHLAKDTASDGAVRAADALGEESKISKKEACPNMTVGPSKPRTSLWITRLATNTLRSEKGKETAKETIGCSSIDHTNGVSPTNRIITTLRNTTSRTEMFDAIRSLRLSRADVIRWMDSEAPLRDLEGFFVRLRLAGLGGGSYYVGCITGESTSNKSILVDVGGMKSSIATQYVSNHDFLEDEIKAWWNRSLGSGCRIPSLAELNYKFNNRHTFGRPTMDGGRRTEQ